MPAVMWSLTWRWNSPWAARSRADDSPTRRCAGGFVVAVLDGQRESLQDLVVGRLELGGAFADPLL